MDWIIIIISLIAAFASIFTKGGKKDGQVKASPLTEEDIGDLMEEARQERRAAAPRAGGGVAGPVKPATISAAAAMRTEAEGGLGQTGKEAGAARHSDGRIDKRKLIIYSEIMRPKFDDAGR